MPIYGNKKILTFLMLFVVAGAGTLPALSFKDLLPSIEESHGVKEARFVLETAADQFTLSIFPGDARMSLSPGLDLTSLKDGDFAEQREITAAVNTSIPLGLNPSGRAAAETAREAVSLAELELETARYNAYVDLFAAYSAAWLAQRELEVLKSELEAAGEELRIVQNLFNSGSASLNDLNDAEDELRLAEADLLAGTLAQRLSWLELAFFAGLNQAREEKLDLPPAEFFELPKPPDLTAWALERSPAIRSQRNQINALRRELDARRGVVSPPTLRADFSGWEQNASLSYNMDNPELGLSYSFPLESYGPDLSSSNSNAGNTWELSFSVNIPFNTGVDTKKEQELGQSRIAQIEARLALMEDTLALQIRSLYQQYLLAEDAISQAQRALDFAEMTLQTVLDRRDSGRATAAEELSARAYFQRALFRQEQAVSARNIQILKTAQAAFWLQELVLWE
ncbi:TolC family protein [Marispirochaeta aestuarii]|uniref:TolC family protein n=1 Tax=Marispirochaeta aestuarii TaxID=1963862 RepID=UPI003749B547